MRVLGPHLPVCCCGLSHTHATHSACAPACCWGEPSAHTPEPRAPTWMGAWSMGRSSKGGRACGLGRGGLPCRWPDALSCRGHGAGISCHASRALQMAHMGPLPQPAWRNPCGHWTVGRTVDELWPGAPSPSSVQCPVSSVHPRAQFPPPTFLLLPPHPPPFFCQTHPSVVAPSRTASFIRFIAPHLDLPINPSHRIASRTATRQSSRPHRATRHPLQTLSTELPPHSAWRLGC